VKVVTHSSFLSDSEEKSHSINSCQSGLSTLNGLYNEKSGRDSNSQSTWTNIKKRLQTISNKVLGVDWWNITVWNQRERSKYS